LFQPEVREIATDYFGDRSDYKQQQHEQEIHDLFHTRGLATLRGLTEGFGDSAGLNPKSRREEAHSQQNVDDRIRLEIIAVYAMTTQQRITTDDTIVRPTVRYSGERRWLNSATTLVRLVA
jgi:hypothetical protein